ncbi:SAM-dependent methyltransferase [Derxia lacustris]|uniref:SAM-dependent methyltransferase n=1 Tax=Derxia lacustris TaxID=764842 RepID=UPI000A176A2D|nr:cyclopropane-fatty-acyl-phospholipid synthase family protein [Derxia lacustris]
MTRNCALDRGLLPSSSPADAFALPGAPHADALALPAAACADAPALPDAAPAPAVVARARSGSRLPWQARRVIGLLDRVCGGSVELTLPDGRRMTLGDAGPGARLPSVSSGMQSPSASPGMSPSPDRASAAAPPLHVDLAVRDWRVFGRLVAEGDLGFARAWVDGDWHTSDLPALLELVARNRAALEGGLPGGAVARAGLRLLHALRRNSRAGSRRNIRAHYDLGNDFYRLWLDAGMTYSGAWYRDGSESLEAAQAAKLGRILDQASAGRSDCRLLEVGCGWGSFAELAARAGHRVHGVTLSPAQLAWGQERLAHAGLAERATLELRDYRDLAERYDGIASIEMFEAVGERWWPIWFDTVARCLAPGGRAAIQTITLDERLFASYRRRPDFIQSDIFPGGMLPTRTRFIAEAARVGLAVRNELALGADYRRTLLEWRARFLARRADVAALGHDECFVRRWDYYLSYCAAGFADRSTDVVQFTLVNANG